MTSQKCNEPDELTQAGSQAKIEEFFSTSMEFTGSQLSDEVLKSIFDAAFIDTEIDDDGDLFVKDDLHVWVQGLPDQDCFSFTAYIGAEGDHLRAKLLEACNKFNQSYLGLKVALVDDNKAIGFNYAVLMKGGAAVDGKEIVRLLKYFQDVVGAAMDDELFSFLAEE